MVSVLRQGRQERRRVGQKGIKSSVFDMVSIRCPLYAKFEGKSRQLSLILRKGIRAGAVPVEIARKPWNWMRSSRE